MIEKTITIRLSEDEAEILRNGTKSEKRTLIEALITDLPEEDERTLFADFCQEFRETYDGIDNVEDTEFENSSTGILYVSFSGSAYLGCKDAISNFDYHEEVAFEIDFAKLHLTFSTNVPDELERDPDTF